jgi:hypothetical protein
MLQELYCQFNVLDAELPFSEQKSGKSMGYPRNARAMAPVETSAAPQSASLPALKDTTVDTHMKSQSLIAL